MQHALLFFFSCCCSFCMAQNLVPNPSFEDTVSCPYAAGDINKATGWISFCGSPDFYCTCNEFDMGVPNNWAGYQMPTNGSAYVGFAAYSNTSLNAREFPACLLTTPLTIGTKYYISFKVALSLTNFIQANCASNKIGAMFATGIYPCNITNSPPVFTDLVITDTLNWTRIAGSFVADSSYNYLIIGNFYDDANTDTVKFFSDFSDNAYYYLDDVCVSMDSSYVYNYNYTGVQENNFNNQYSFYPNPATDFVTIQNSFNTPFNLTVFNSLGQQFYFKQSITSNNLQLDVSSYNAGLLFIQIASQNNQYIYKLLKQ